MSEAVRKLALFFADIVGYSRMMHAGEAAAVEQLHAWRRLLRQEIEGRGGTVVEFTGDSAFAHFERAVDAVEAALAIQQHLAETDTGGRHRLQCRIGIHWGTVVERDGRLYGDHLNIAARLEPLSLPGAACISQAVVDRLPDPHRLHLFSCGTPPLKNIDARIRVYQLFPQAPDRLTRLRLRGRRLVNLGKRHPVASGALTLALLGGLLLLLLNSLPPQPASLQVELRGIRNLSPNELPAYYTIGVEDEIRRQLGRLPNLYLARPEEGTRAPLVLEGEIRKQGRLVYVSYRLQQRDDGTLVASHELHGRLSEMLKLQERLALDLARTLSTRYHLAWLAPARAESEVPPEAYQYYLQGKNYLARSKEKGVLKSAETLFLRALAIAPDYADALAGLCRTYWQEYEEARRLELSEKAEQACRRALELDPDSAMAQAALGEVLLGRGKWQEAAQAYEKAIELDPRYTEAYLGLADAYVELGRPDLAEQTYQRAIELKGASWNAWTAYGRYLFRRGLYPEAIEAFRKVVELTPDDARAYSRLGAVYMLTGNFAKAAETLVKGAEIRPSADLLSNSGTMYYYDHAFDKAVRMYRKAIQKAPEICELWINLGDALTQQQGQEAEARQAYQRAETLCRQDLEVNPRNYAALLFLGRALSMLGKGKEAEEKLAAARHLEQGDPMVFYNAAMVHAVLKNEQALRQDLEQAIELGYPRALVRAEPFFSPYRERGWFKAL